MIVKHPKTVVKTIVINSFQSDGEYVSMIFIFGCYKNTTGWFSYYTARIRCRRDFKYGYIENNEHLQLHPSNFVCSNLSCGLCRLRIQNASYWIEWFFFLFTRYILVFSSKSFQPFTTFSCRFLFDPPLWSHRQSSVTITTFNTNPAWYIWYV